MFFFSLGRISFFTARPQDTLVLRFFISAGTWLSKAF